MVIAAAVVGAGLWLAGQLLAATAVATINQLYAQAALVGETTFRAGIVQIDAPLTLTRDASGRAHLGVLVPPVPRAVIETVALAAVPPEGYTLAHLPVAGAMFAIVHSSAFGQDYVTVVAPAVDSPLPRLVTFASLPAHALTDADTATVAYWTVEP
jgi:hypothetical protein